MGLNSLLTLIAGSVQVSLRLAADPSMSILLPSVSYFHFFSLLLSETILSRLNVKNAVKIKG